MQVKRIIEITQDIDALIQLSRQYMAGLYPTDSIYQEDPSRLLADDIFFIGVYLEANLAGIGAVKKIETSPGYGEIKNLFVDPEYRGRGISRLIMGRLEQHLIDQQISVCRLETGVHQPESINLYRGQGYSETSPFGDYKPDPLSIFMQKSLSGL